MYTVEELYTQYGKSLGLEIVCGEGGLKRSIRLPEAHRPGLAMSGYLKGFIAKRILIFGRSEIEYLRELKSSVCTSQLKNVLHPKETPCVIVARRFKAPKELQKLCEEFGIPLFRSNMSTMNLLSQTILNLIGEFAPAITLHGTLVEVFGMGVLIQGDSSVGKSEAALGLIERGHRLIADDVVRVKKREGYLEGYGTELTKHHMEIRGIGIINVAHLYGAVCVRDAKSIDLVVLLENWDDQSFYDRVGVDEKYIELLDIDLPHHILPVKPGRDVVLLLETIALNHRLKGMGYNSAKEFKKKLLAMTSS